MRAVMCVDVEPDRREVEMPGPVAWHGTDDMLRDHHWLRDAMGGPSPVTNWFVRIDAQIELAHGVSTWAAEHYSTVLTELSAGGDEIGLHPHNWRWCDGRWVSDGTDGWVGEVVAGGISGFRTTFGFPCTSYRHGDRFMSEVIVRALLDDPDVVVDLTIEPGMPAETALVPSERTIGVTEHVDLAASQPFQPSPLSVDIADPPDGRLTMVPLTTAVVPASGRVGTLMLWRDPEEFQRMVRLRLLDPELEHLAFAIRTDLALIPWARTNIPRNLRWLRAVLPDLEWVAASDMALTPSAAVPSTPRGVAGSMAHELDGVIDRVVHLGVACRPGAVVDAVDRLATVADEAQVELASVREDNGALRARLRRAEDAAGAAKQRAAADRERASEAAARAAAVELQLAMISTTATFRIRERLLPLMRPVVRVMRRLTRQSRH